jgi:hypothetical protein
MQDDYASNNSFCFFRQRTNSEIRYEGNMDLFQSCFHFVEVIAIVSKWPNVNTRLRLAIFACYFLLLMYVNELMSYECSDEGTYTQNIRNSSTR